MAITKKAGRQSILTAVVSFALADLINGTAVAAVDLPANARVSRVTARIDTAFNSGTNDALVIQSNEGTPKAYITVGAGANALPASKVFSSDPGPSGVASCNIGFTNPVASTIDVKWTGTGTAATTGAGTLFVDYVIDNREFVTQG